MFYSVISVNTSDISSVMHAMKCLTGLLIKCFLQDSQKLVLCRVLSVNAIDDRSLVGIYALD